MMLTELTMWSQKLKDGLQLAHSFYQDHGASLPKHITKIAFVGMGGSGVAGRIMKTFLDRKPGITTIIVDTPIVPESIDTQTLVFVMSYSGQTWETLDVLEAITQKFIPTIVLAHGGRAIEIAQAKDLPFLLLPQSLTPRSALGTFLSFLSGLFDLMGILPGTAMVNQWVKEVEKYVPSFVEGAYFKDFLGAINNPDVMHVWGIGGDSAAAAYRASTQFNENSKQQAVFNVFPELMHNLMVGFEKFDQPPVVLWFHTDFIPAHLSVAVQTISEILREKQVLLYKPPIFGDTFESQVFTMILWADFASYHLGLARGVNVERVQIIDELKKRQKSKGIK